MTQTPFPEYGRLLGIDYGTVRVGIAICDPARRMSSPYENYSRRTDSLDAAYFRKLVAAEQVVGLVVGLPVHTNGLESAKSLEARHYGQWLAEVTGQPVTFHDERYSSSEAESLLSTAGQTKKRRKARLDMVAAHLILASFLERDAGSSSASQALWDEPS